MKQIKNLFVVLINFASSIFLLTVVTLAAPSQASTKYPADKQILPYHTVRLEWNDVTNEHHYLLSIRDITTGESGPLIYNAQYIQQNSTYFDIPTSRIARGHIYRWSLSTVDASGNRTFSPNRHFKTEYGASNGWDTHILKIGYANASHIDYFIHAPAETGDPLNFDSAIQGYVNQWNNISSNVYLHRDYSDTTRELGIYKSNQVSGELYGKTFPGGIDNVNVDIYNDHIVTYTDIVIYIRNLPDYQTLGSNDSTLRYTVLHEVGHALSLAHTNGVDYQLDPQNAPAGNSIAKTYAVMDSLSDHDKKYPNIANDSIYLVMNQGGGAPASYITNTDKAHLKIKWGD